MLKRLDLSSRLLCQKRILPKHETFLFLLQCFSLLIWYSMPNGMPMTHVWNLKPALDRAPQIHPNLANRTGATAVVVAPNSKSGCASKICKHAQPWSRRIVEALCAVQKGSRKLKLQSYVAIILSMAIQLCVEDDFVSDGLVCNDCKTISLIGYEISLNKTARFSVPVLFWKLKTFQRDAEVDEVVGQQDGPDGPLFIGLSRLGRSNSTKVSELWDHHS